MPSIELTLEEVTQLLDLLEYIEGDTNYTNTLIWDDEVQLGVIYQKLYEALKTKAAMDA